MNRQCSECGREIWKCRLISKVWMECKSCEVRKEDHQRYLAERRRVSEEGQERRRKRLLEDQLDKDSYQEILDKF